jgi:DNA-binding HxlR family transcriptional regulator
VIPSEIVEFLRLSVRSVWTLELLLLLRRDSARSWRADELVREMRASQKIVDESLAALAVIGLVVVAQDGAIAYRAETPLDAMIDRLAELYRERPLSVTQAIHDGPTAKIQTFADSFKLRKD